MATKKEKVGALIRSARTEAGLTQDQLAKKVDGLTASEVSKAERGEIELTKEELKGIAIATGVTQKSLLEAAGYTSTAKSTSSKSTSKGSTAKTAKTNSSSKTTASDEFKLTAAEKKLVELYRAADSDTKKAAVSLLKGEQTSTEDILTNLIGTAVDLFTKK